MSDFVAECRREWKRLRVPDAVADEMAADLAADLSEAATDGVSAEELLGTDALDARSFAAAWAAERGVVESRSATKRRTSTLLAAAIAALCVAALAAGVAILATPSVTTSALPASPDAVGAPKTVWVAVAAPKTASKPPTVTFVPGPADLVIAPLPSDRGTSTRTIAWILLATGIVGIVLATTLFWWRVSRRQSYA